MSVFHHVWVRYVLPKSIVKDSKLRLYQSTFTETCRKAQVSRVETSRASTTKLSRRRSRRRILLRTASQGVA